MKPQSASNIVRIFLASSSELEEDRRAFEIEINRKNKEWNSRGVFLHLDIWEDSLDTVSPTRSQDEYNRLVLAADIFVMLFFSKVGIYTREEFEIAFEQFKSAGLPKILVYRKKGAIDTDDLNERDVQSLFDFKKRLNEIQHFPSPYATGEGLVHEFNGQLEKLVQAGVIQIQSAHPIATAPAKFEDTPAVQSFIQTYLRFLAGELTGLTLGGIDVSAQQTGRQPLELADVYVPLNVEFLKFEEVKLAYLASRNFTEGPLLEGGGHITKHQECHASALEALGAHRRLTLLGKPGSGKSTFGASVLLALAQMGLEKSEAAATLGEYWTHGALLPIRVVLRRFAEALPAGDADACADDLWNHIAESLTKESLGEVAEIKENLRRLARERGAFFLLDGLDECGSPQARMRVRAAVEKFIKTAGEKSRFLLTARPYAFPQGADPRQGVYELADLNDEQVEAFIKRWYCALHQPGWLGKSAADEKRDELVNAWRRADLEPLARNPLLLTLMATLHANRRRLPDDRADLYQESVDLLMLRWNEQIGADKALLDELKSPLKLSDLREILEKLAFDVHYRQALTVGQAANGVADIGEDRLVRDFTPLLGSRDKAAIVVEYIEKRAGLLIGQGERDGERQFAFSHRTFQEFLAACYLASLKDFESRCASLACEAPAHWQVVLSLAARVAKVDRGASAADELIRGESVADRFVRQRPEAEDWICAQLAGDMLLEIGVGAVNSRDRPANIAKKVRDWLVAGLSVHPSEGGAVAAQRARAGATLARLGDPRFDPQRFYLPVDNDLGFVHIPADPHFRMGTLKADVARVATIIGGEVPDDETNDVQTPTSEFYITRYPVTVAQFRAFVQDSGHEIGFDHALLGQDNAPVVWASWDEAQSYCQWLTHKLRESSLFTDSGIFECVHAKGWQVDFPTEVEWEKAARGGKVGRIFPWGDVPDPERANYNESGISGVSAVGCFPVNGYGLQDMVGNVWEWTKVPGDDEAVWRVMRGGSRNSDAGEARSAFRYLRQRDIRSRSRGFRLVLKSRFESSPKE